MSLTFQVSVLYNGLIYFCCGLWKTRKTDACISAFYSAACDAIYTSVGSERLFTVFY
jgi:hypothetical protein